MSKFLLHPLAWSIYLLISMSAMAQSQPESQIAELEKITVKAEESSENSNSSTVVTQFDHSLLDVHLLSLMYRLKILKIIIFNV